MCPRIPLLLAFLLNLFASTLGVDGFSNSPHEVLRVDGGPAGVVWVVQVSDIHISKWKPERGRALRSALGHALKLIKPAIVLITGDLTGMLLFFLFNASGIFDCHHEPKVGGHWTFKSSCDCACCIYILLKFSSLFGAEAKNQEKTASQQYEEEWIEYRDSLQKVVDDSSIPLRRFNDVRGNHDRYGVPPSSNLDYYSKYSISAALNRSSLVQSVTVEVTPFSPNTFLF